MIDTNTGLYVVAAHVPLGGLRILVLDDDEAAREALIAVLQAEGATVVAVGSAASAFDQLDRERPDVMLVDIGMPVVDGFTFVEQVRQRPLERGGRVPAAALTGYLSSEDRARAVRAGFQAYLVKPVDPQELIRTLNRLASGAEG